MSNSTSSFSGGWSSSNSSASSGRSSSSAGPQVSPEFIQPPPLNVQTHKSHNSHPRLEAGQRVPQTDRTLQRSINRSRPKPPPKDRRLSDPDPPPRYLVPLPRRRPKDLSKPSHTLNKEMDGSAVYEYNGGTTLAGRPLPKILEPKFQPSGPKDLSRLISRSEATPKIPTLEVETSTSLDMLEKADAFQTGIVQRDMLRWKETQGRFSHYGSTKTNSSEREN